MILIEGALASNVAPSDVKPKLEIQNNNHSTKKFVTDIPEYGGSNERVGNNLELHDMSPSERKQNFGSYGAFDVCFNPQNVHKYTKKQ